MNLLATLGCAGQSRQKKVGEETSMTIDQQVLPSGELDPGEAESCGVASDRGVEA